MDALDEALTLDSPSNIVRLLASRLNRLPPWLRIVATTRNEPDVLEHLSTLRAKELSAEDPRNRQDIHRYIATRLKTPNLAAELAQSGATEKTVTDTLLEKSEGNFLYVRQALDAVEREQYRLDRLDELPTGLGEFYLRWFQRNFPDEARFQSVRRVLEVVTAAAEPLTHAQLAAASELDPRRGLTAVMRTLNAYVPPRMAADGHPRYAIYHKSLADWLTDPTRAGASYAIDPAEGHQQLSAAGLREYAQSAASLSPYHTAHLPAHLIAAERWDDLETLLTDLQFVEAKSTIGQTIDLVRDFNDALAALPELQDEHNREQQRQQSLRQYGADLIAYASPSSPVIDVSACRVTVGL